MTWVPPEAPDPSEILASAVSETQNARYAQALDKFLWFHHHALRYERSLGGVRLSFALGYWMDLAAVYQPAKDAIVRTRDESEAAFLSAPGLHPSKFDLFHDLASLNELLGDGVRTADLFLNTARHAPDIARVLYNIAEPFLIAIGRYDACEPFLDPAARMRRAEDNHETLKRFEDTAPASACPRPPLARMRYMRDVAILIGLLALNHRVDEAKTAQMQALSVLDTEEFRALLGAAMTGHLPPPLFS